MFVFLLNASTIFSLLKFISAMRTTLVNCSIFTEAPTGESQELVILVEHIVVGGFRSIHFSYKKLV